MVSLVWMGVFLVLCPLPRRAGPRPLRLLPGPSRLPPSLSRRGIGASPPTGSAGYGAPRRRKC